MRTVGRHRQVRVAPGAEQTANGFHGAPRRGAAHRRNAQASTDPGDYVAIGVLAHEHMDVRSGVLIDGQQQVFMPHRIDQTPGQLGLIWVEIFTQRALLKSNCPHPDTQNPGAGDAGRFDYKGMTDFDGGLPSGLWLRRRIWIMRQATFLHKANRKLASGRKTLCGAAVSDIVDTIP
jgi:hypothetical protein